MLLICMSASSVWKWTSIIGFRGSLSVMLAIMLSLMACALCSCRDAGTAIERLLRVGAVVRTRSSTVGSSGIMQLGCTTGGEMMSLRLTRDSTGFPCVINYSSVNGRVRDFTSSTVNRGGAKTTRSPLTRSTDSSIRGVCSVWE